MPLTPIQPIPGAPPERWYTSALGFDAMAAKKRKATTRRGPNTPDSQRHTKRVTVHVAPEVEAELRPGSDPR